MTYDIKENKTGRTNKIVFCKTSKPLALSSMMVSNFGELEHRLCGMIIIGANSTIFCILFTIFILRYCFGVVFCWYGCGCGNRLLRQELIRVGSKKGEL